MDFVVVVGDVVGTGTKKGDVMGEEVGEGDDRSVIIADDDEEEAAGDLRGETAGEANGEDAENPSRGEREAAKASSSAKLVLSPPEEEEEDDDDDNNDEEGASFLAGDFLRPLPAPGAVIVTAGVLAISLGLLLSRVCCGFFVFVFRLKGRSRDDVQRMTTEGDEKRRGKSETTHKQAITKQTTQRKKRKERKNEKDEKKQRKAPKKRNRARKRKSENVPRIFSSFT